MIFELVYNDEFKIMVNAVNKEHAIRKAMTGRVVDVEVVGELDMCKLKFSDEIVNANGLQ